MTQSKAEVMRALVEAWNQGVREVPSEHVDAAVELESPFTSVSGQPYRGHAGIERWMQDIDAHFSEWHTDLDEVHEVGDAVAGIGKLRGRGRESGVELDQAYAIVLDFERGQRITRVRIYWDLDAARGAVGLTGP